MTEFITLLKTCFAHLQFYLLHTCHTSHCETKYHRIWLFCNPFLIEFHIFNDKQCRSRSAGFFRSQLIWIYSLLRKGMSCSAREGLITELLLRFLEITGKLVVKHPPKKGHTVKKYQWRSSWGAYLTMLMHFSSDFLYKSMCSWSLFELPQLVEATQQVQTTNVFIKK